MPKSPAPATRQERKKFKLERVRLSYPALFKARAMKSDSGEEKDPEFSASFILDKKKHADIIKAVNEEAKKVAIDKWGKVPARFRGPVRDGATFVDEELTEDTDEPVYKQGCGPEVVIIAAKSKAKPHCVTRDPSVAAEESDLYGGCYVNVVITLFPWEHKANGKGVSANLGCVQFVANGERFGAPVLKAEDHFEDLGEEDDGDVEEEEDEKPAKKPGKKPAANLFD